MSATVQLVVDPDVDGSDPDVADGGYAVDRHSAESDLLVSPELVLIDPELAQLARALLPDYSDDAEGEDGASVSPPDPTTPASTPVWRPGDRRLGRGAAESIAPLSLPEPLFKGADANSWRLATGVEVLERDRARPLPARLARRIVVSTIFLLGTLTAIFAVLAFDSEPEVRSPSHDGPQELDPGEAQALPQTIAPGQPRRDGRREGPRVPSRNAARVRPASAPSIGRAVRIRPARARSNSRRGSRESGEETVGTPPSNVLGVVVTPGDRVVELSWARPPDSHHVVVLREHGVPVGERVVYRDGKVVYRGAATRYKDLGVKNGVEYRYVIVSYDRGGNASSGVPTVVIPKIPPPGA